ncbi:GlsB/YeaQ/YmgE family stress response membrane protein [Roseibacterium sp. SDUM158017]|uniref:GlsB/YeaQ/YmgE family stress response membrane protein n=1 Tax=Roseicyclus salinarum TaxID=3036773 RepID=UPI0024151EA5|nr:GlsB/YeaQ/YmgE family stress response membrane protein [Roseibacterium sp. SDUM158017]MDG4647078.1 GlsB/YeaQ/YmgE family stress response membrane protein [Roseibacterium sp. SDUM158017]
MQGLGLLMSIVVGGFAGWIAERIMKARHGLLKNIVLGILGALLGNFILTNLTGETLPGIFGQLIVAVAGASILIFVGRAITRR